MCHFPEQAVVEINNVRQSLLVIQTTQIPAQARVMGRENKIKVYTSSIVQSCLINSYLLVLSQNSHRQYFCI